VSPPMFSGSYLRRGALTLALATAIFTAGCGPGGAADDAAKVAGKTLPKLTRGLKRPAMKAAVPAARTATEFELALTSGFCEGYAFYRDYGRVPTTEEWYDLAMRQLGSAFVGPPGVVEQAVSTYESVVRDLQSGQLTTARVDLFCQYGI
jgi:hypothetical protein